MGLFCAVKLTEACQWLVLVEFGIYVSTGEWEPTASLYRESTPRDLRPMGFPLLMVPELRCASPFLGSLVPGGPIAWLLMSSVVNYKPKPISMVLW
jgi:hypothetical protein